MKKIPCLTILYPLTLIYPRLANDEKVFVADTELESSHKKKCFAKGKNNGV